MAELRKIVKSPVQSNFSQTGPTGGSVFFALAETANAAYQFIEPALKEHAGNLGAEAGAELARRQMGQASFPIVPRTAPQQAAGGDLSSFSPDGSGSGLKALADKHEGGGSYKTLFGHSQKDGKAFAGVDVENMTIGQVLNFQSTSGKYGQWVAKQVGRVATPAGRWQIVGTTLRAAAKAMNLSMDTMFNQQTQDQIFDYLATKRLKSASSPEGKRRAMRAEWEGFKHVSDAELDVAIAEYEGGRASTKTAPPEVATGAPTESALQSLPATEPPTVVRSKDGTLEPRMFSPLSGPILQAHRAAASTAYLSEMLVRGGTDMMGLSENYQGDPEGFNGAMQNYVDEVVKAAPGMMKAELRSKLTNEGQRRFMGMVEDQQRETRERANNSSRALVDRYSNDYAEAMASGNAEAAADARGNLEGILVARESLPGVAWTREQSENVILQSQEAAQKITEQNQAKVKSDQASTLRTIIAAASDGRTAADESILDDPNVVALNPELAQEAAAKVVLRDMMPGFFALPPAEMQAAIEEERARPVTEGWELDLVKPMQDALAASSKALRDDPIAYAQQRLPEKPPAIDAFSPDDPDSFVASLAARREYANGLMEGGFVDKPAFLSKAEVESLSAILSKDTPPEIRAAVSGAIVAGFGADAGRVFKSLKTDPVTAWGGQMMAKGGSTAIATEAQRGQQLIDERLVQMPEENKWRAAFQGDMREALSGLPLDSVQAEAEIMGFAKAIYANRASAPGFEADDAAMTDAIQAALGQATAPNGDVTGGIQGLFRSQTLMPIGMNAEQIQNKIVQSFIPQGSAWDRAVAPLGSLTADDNPDFWATASVQEMPDGSFKSAGVPFVGGEPLPMKLVTGGDVKFIPVDGTKYRMVVERPNASFDVHDDEGNAYIIDFARIK